MSSLFCKIKALTKYSFWFCLKFLSWQPILLGQSYFCFGSAGNWTQSLKHAKQVLCHW
jgi:hypothetical protein